MNAPGWVYVLAFVAVFLSGVAGYRYGRRQVRRQVMRARARAVTAHLLGRMAEENSNGATPGPATVQAEKSKYGV